MITNLRMELFEVLLECLTFSAPLPLPEGLAVVPPGGGHVQQQEEDSGGGECREQHGDQRPGEHCQPWLIPAI